MNLHTLNEFRHGMYGSFGNGKDALFNLVDALSSEAGARSFPELSLSPFFEQTWASVYEALEDGQIDAEHLCKVFVDFAPLPQPGEFVFLGVDIYNIPWEKKSGRKQECCFSSLLVLFSPARKNALSDIIFSTCQRSWSVNKDALQPNDCSRSISLRNPWESDISLEVTIIALVHFARKG